MTAEDVITALDLPSGAWVDQRVPKKLLLEYGAPTAADKRLINEGIEETRWLAVLKPMTLGVPAYLDDTRQYLEIAVLQVDLRAGARAARLIELIHRVIPYPILLLVLGAPSAQLCVAHKRHALNEAGKEVIEGGIVRVALDETISDVQINFLASLAVDKQPRASLLAFYQGWVDRFHALQAARVTGEFRLLDSVDAVAHRRDALHACVALQERIAALRAAALKATQIVKQVELNIELRRVQDELSSARLKL